MNPSYWRRRGAVALVACSMAMPAVPCTTFVTDGPDGPLFARNYDFDFGEALLVVNPRGLRKSADVPGQQAATWTARHGSLTFNQYGVGFPTGGVNEAGVVVELMWLDGSRYPDADARPAVSTLQFIQYLLDRSDSLPQALEAAREVRIAGRTPLHFLVADATGRSATLEFLDGRLVVHQGQNLPVRVLANDPYAQSISHLKRFNGFGGTQPLPDDRSSLSRFVRAADRLRERPAGVAPAFATLDDVAQPGFTHWQIVYELRRGRVHYRTAAQRAPRWVDLAQLDFGCAAGLRVMNIDEGQGDRSARWRPYAQALNEAQLRVAYRKTAWMRQMSDEDVARSAQEDAAYPATMRCDSGGAEEKSSADRGG
ncbi:linear amide C-N hydrolase [Ideonella sp. BN130291]|uniref:linear amide C-N hydrolase n=1 Tax=Ideonella sp. BN130291 TaxID=3112940 RepID=UPI002E276169|nr:linear amide C-N hydrolase [Ideonella sp. BN130291]